MMNKFKIITRFSLNNAMCIGMGTSWPCICNNGLTMAVEIV